jgi:hypothetical protein
LSHPAKRENKKTNNKVKDERRVSKATDNFVAAVNSNKQMLTALTTGQQLPSKYLVVVYRRTTTVSEPLHSY